MGRNGWVAITDLIRVKFLQTIDIAKPNIIEVGQGPGNGGGALRYELRNGKTIAIF